MMNLMKITQTTHDGRKKIWKLQHRHPLVVFGCSRKADLVSIEAHGESFTAVLEYKNFNWHYISFSPQAEQAETLVKNGHIIKLPTSDLKFETSENNLQLLKSMEYLSKGTGVQTQVFLIIKNNRLLNTFASPAHKKVLLNLGGQIQKMDLATSQDWTEIKIGDYSIKSKLMSAPDISIYLKNSKQLLPVETQKGLGFTFGATLLIVLLSFLMAKKESPFAAHIPTQSAQILVTKKDLKKSKNRQLQASEPANSADSGATSSASEKHMAARLKTSVGLRISQLLGKVSSTEARTKNVLVTTNGNAADQLASGRALSSVGKVASSGRNWNGEVLGFAGKVSTVGHGGGQSGKGLASGLGQGKTGTGGVGLIEDESEVVGGLDREIIAQYIKTQLGQILYCYERQLSANPNLYGKIAVKFTITGTGGVETQTINDTTLKNISVESCILNKISKWKFPEPKGGTKVLVTYPFLFKSTI
jgi:hypothetical protein